MPDKSKLKTEIIIYYFIFNILFAILNHSSVHTNAVEEKLYYININDNNDCNYYQKLFVKSSFIYNNMRK